MFLPIVFMLLMGLVEFGRLAYTYFAVQKTLYSMARYLGTQQGVNFCDEADPAIVAAKNYALTGTTDGSATPLIADLSADSIRVRAEKYNPDSGEISACTCDASGCDALQGGLGPDFIVISVPDGYPVQLRIPFMAQLDPIPLRPQIRVPYGGT